MDIGSLIAIVLLGFVCGVIGRALVPNDAFRAMSGWKSWLASTVLGLIGALVGYWIFTGLLGIGDSDKFDWGGIIGAVIGAIIVVALGSWAIKKFAKGSVA
ncbi:MAG TPA: GlsB/YeaQ/YmgE family stress response membrane protein [Ilumatobacteraceae bacterium]|nr:GlsB/YeaQ/YmgE family stress response membrane protein [Ilumatobacteraceae bacterium]